MKRRKFFLNDRVRAMISLFFIMMFTILVVFAGIEGIRHMSGLTPEQQEYLKKLNYPIYFKLMVVLVWVIVSILSAHLYLLYKYSGFMDRLGHYCQGLTEKDKGQVFYFRQNENTMIVRESFEAIIKTYRKELADLGGKLGELKVKLKARSMG